MFVKLQLSILKIDIKTKNVRLKRKWSTVRTRKRRLGRRSAISYIIMFILYCYLKQIVIL